MKTYHYLYMILITFLIEPLYAENYGAAHFSFVLLFVLRMSDWLTGAHFLFEASFVRIANNVF